MRPSPIAELQEQHRVIERLLHDAKEKGVHGGAGLAAFLKAESFASESELESIVKEVEREVDDAAERAKTAEKPGRDTVELFVFSPDVDPTSSEFERNPVPEGRPETMVAAFELTGKSKAEVEEQFGGLYRAFQYGAPPHGGAAFGIDRIVMLLCGAQNLREITLFPMNQQAEDLLMGAPSAATAKQLRELHIRLNVKE